MCILIKFSIVEINQFVLNLFYIRLQLFDIYAVGETGPILDTGPSWTVALKIVNLVLRPWF